MRPTQYFFIVPLAYLFAGIEKLFSLPVYVYVTTFFVVSLLATTIALTPQQVAKIQLSSSPQSLEDYARFLQHTQASGDTQLTQRVYETIAPLLQKESAETQAVIKHLAFPQLRVGEQLAFWNEVYAKQPNSREANAALTVLSYQTFDEERYQQYLQRWKELEPNDERLRIFSNGN